MARYIVKTNKFKCGDESGVDAVWPFNPSDEPYWVFTTVCESEQTAETFNSRVHGDVDSGDVRTTFPTTDGQNVVWPTHQARLGAPGPICMSVQLFENDNGDPKRIREQVEKALGVADRVPILDDLVEDIPEAVRGWFPKLLGDDLMGSQTILIPTARLESALKNPGDSYQQWFDFGGQNGDLPFLVAGGPNYRLALDVIRTRDDGTYEESWVPRPPSGKGDSTRVDNPGTGTSRH